MSKDYSVIDGICRNFEYEAKTIFNKGYDQGVEDTKYDREKAYNQGLEDAWKVIKKVALNTEHGGIDGNSLKKIFGTYVTTSIILHYSVYEVIENIKAWEEEQTERDCETCAHQNESEYRCSLCLTKMDGLTKYEPKINKIKVGDEVYILDKEYPYVITSVDPIKKSAVFFSRFGKWGVEDISKLHKTGRHFPEISEVLKQMWGEE